MSHPPEGTGKPVVPDSAVSKRGALDAPTSGKNSAAQILGQRGGLARAERMSPERRSEIARVAAKRRWEKGSGG